MSDAATNPNSLISKNAIHSVTLVAEFVEPLGSYLFQGGEGQLIQLSGLPRQINVNGARLLLTEELLQVQGPYRLITYTNQDTPVGGK